MAEQNSKKQNLLPPPEPPKKVEKQVVKKSPIHNIGLKTSADVGKLIPFSSDKGKKNSQKCKVTST